MGFHVKFGNRYFKKTRNRRIFTVDAILGTKEQAKVYGLERDAKKAITTHEYQYPELKGKLVIVPIKEASDDNNTTS